MYVYYLYCETYGKTVFEMKSTMYNEMLEFGQIWNEKSPFNTFVIVERNARFEDK